MERGGGGTLTACRRLDLGQPPKSGRRGLTSTRYTIVLTPSCMCMRLYCSYVDVTCAWALVRVCMCSHTYTSTYIRRGMHAPCHTGPRWALVRATPRHTGPYVTVRACMYVGPYVTVTPANIETAVQQVNAPWCPPPCPYARVDCHQRGSSSHPSRAPGPGTA